MPVLKDFRHTKEIALPSYPESIVTIYHSLLANDSDLAMGLDKEAKPSRILLLLHKLIKDWNFTDEAGVALPVTAENINLLEQEDIVYIIEQVEEFSNSLKKK